MLHILHAFLACTSDADCSYNGVCKSAECHCEPAWHGPSCERLSLLPTPANAGYRAADAGGALTSWGGAVLQDEATGVWHMWAAELVGHCDMAFWLGNSQVVHATADTFLGPYQRREVVHPVFAHEPNVVRAPTGEWVMFYTSSPKIPTTTGPDGEPGGVPCSCAPDGTPHNCSAWRDWSAPLYTYMSWTRDPAGGWSAPVLIPQANATIDTNFAPVIKADGSLIGLYRDDACGSSTNLHLVTATDWRRNETYRESRDPIAGGVVGAGAGVFDGPEDPFVWIDPAGRLHSLFHEWPHPSGPHAFSADGTDWRWARGGPDPSGNCTEAPCAYTSALELTAGRKVGLSGRERPHLVFSNGTIVGLVNGMCAPGERSRCWTGLQRVKTSP